MGISDRHEFFNHPLLIDSSISLCMQILKYEGIDLLSDDLPFVMGQTLLFKLASDPPNHKIGIYQTSSDLETFKIRDSLPDNSILIYEAEMLERYKGTSPLFRKSQPTYLHSEWDPRRIETEFVTLMNLFYN